MLKLRIIHLILALAVISLLPVEGFSKTFLVAVGVSDYPGDDKDLKLPAFDAKAMAKLYKQNKGSEVVLLTDSKATRSEVLSSIKNTFADAAPTDIVVFYFAGHGSQGVFLAYDGKLTYDEVRSAISVSKSKNKMIFADACHSGSMRTSKKNGSTKKSDSNVMLFLSSRDDETSMEYTTMDNGLFTTCLIDALKGASDSDRNRTITAKELFTFVSKHVKKMSSNLQHPVMWGNFSDTMPVMKW